MIIEASDNNEVILIQRQNTMRITRYISVILISSLFSCRGSADKSPHEIKADSVQIETVLKKGDAESFLVLFSEIVIDTFHVYSEPSYHDDPKFRGKQIGPEFNHLFAFDSELTYSLSDERGPKDSFFACYKFKLAADKTGLLIRIPSNYDLTALDLFVWDNRKGYIESRESLSDAFGDEGYQVGQDSWISDFNRDGMIDILKRMKHHNVDMDDTTKVSSSDSISVLLARGNKFKKHTLPIDTSKFELKSWKP